MAGELLLKHFPPIPLAPVRIPDADKIASIIKIVDDQPVLWAQNDSQNFSTIYVTNTYNDHKGHVGDAAQFLGIVDISPILNITGNLNLNGQDVAVLIDENSKMLQAKIDALNNTIKLLQQQIFYMSEAIPNVDFPDAPLWPKLPEKPL